MIYENALAWTQVRTAMAVVVQSQKDGSWYARLLQSNPKIAQRFSDHERVAELLEDANEIDTLALVCSSGLLDAESSRPYRQAHRRLTHQ